MGLGHHPYLSPGSGLVDDATLKFSAGTRIETDPERQLPIGRTPVAGTPYDFAVARVIGQTAFDYAFTDLRRDEKDRIRLELTGADARTVEFLFG